MFLRKLAVLSLALASFGLGQQAMAQDELTCDEIEWSSMVTDQYPNIADACDAVVEKKRQAVCPCSGRAATGARTLANLQNSE